MPNSKSVVHFLPLDFGWLITILWMVDDNPDDGKKIHGYLTGLNFMSYIYVPNSKSVVHFLMVYFGWLVTILGMVGDHPGDGG